MNNYDFSQSLVNSISERSEENFDLFSEFINPSFVKLLKIAGFGRRFISSKGFELTDDKGNTYIDFLSGYGTLNIGHNHPGIKDALKAVLSLDVPGFTQVDCGIMTGMAAEALVNSLPGSLDKVYFCSSGSEAVDAAIKLARGATKKKRIIYCEGAFHGNTLSVLSMADNPSRKNRFRPLIPGMVRVPFGDLDSLACELKWKDSAAMVVEPIQGEGGAIVPEKDYLCKAMELCRKKGALFIVDEVQTGLGRSGKMYAIEHSGIEPDVITLAKSLSGGFIPVGAMVVNGKLFNKVYGSLQTCLDHKNTFSGSPLAMTAVMASLNILKQEDLAQKAYSNGKYLFDGLLALEKKHSQVIEARGIGLMLGLKLGGISIPGLKSLIPDGLEKTSAELYTQHVVIQLLKKHRIVTQVAANDFSVLKIMPPLIITKDAIDIFINALDSVLSEGGFGNAVVSMVKEMVRS